MTEFIKEYNGMLEEIKEIKKADVLEIIKDAAIHSIRLDIEERAPY